MNTRFTEKRFFWWWHRPVRPSQEHTTLGMVVIIIMAASTIIRIPVAETVEATLGLAEKEILEVYPTTNKAMQQVQVSSLTPKLLNTDYKTSMFLSMA